MYVTVLYLLSVVLGIVHLSAAEDATSTFKPLCDIHTTNPGRRAPDNVFPQKANNSWLQIPKAELEKWYKIGELECKAYLESAKAELSSGHADFFTDPNKIPMKTQCRGRNTVLDYAGVVLWPFGPYRECPTYSQCWFGILSCGKPKNEEIKSSAIPKIEAAMKTFRVPGEIPAFTKWSVRAVSLLVRVIGAEIVVPDVRYVTLGNKEDVLVGQYVLTRAAADTKLEIRLFELYPSVLFDWSTAHIEQYGMHNHGSLFLGGSEGRCRPWTQCRTPNNCCGCDEKSFLVNTPAAITVTDGLSRCPANTRTQPLPLCPVRDSTQPGRWIASDLPTFTPHCAADTRRNTHFHKDPSALKNQAHPGDVVNHKAFRLADHHHNGSEWFEASGDPCLVNGKEPEDGGRSHWFYAPYTCKYHFYNAVELHKCLSDQKLTHIHVAGDSMSRELFAYLSVYLGVPQIDEAELKRRTNLHSEKHVMFNSGNVMLSEGYSWDFNLGVMQLAEKAPLPNIYITNYALAHRNWPLPKFADLFNETEYQYWTKLRPTNIPKPEYMFFQNAKEMSGRRNIGWVSNMFRQDSAYLTRNYTSLGFAELDEFLFSTGRYDFTAPHADGWHFGGSARQMEVVALFNMVCNDWLKNVKKV